MSESARAASAIVSAAQGAPGLDAWQGEVFVILRAVGFDVAFLQTKPPEARFFPHGLDARILARARQRWPVYERELLAVSRAAASDGVAVDSDVLGGARERRAYYQELVRPHRGAHSLFAHLGLGGREIGGLMLGRTGRTFDDAERAFVRALVAPLSVGLAAVASLRAGPAAAATGSGVTSREAEVLALVRLGYRNREIARALGTSPNTVKNQIASLFAKLGATTRAELVAITAP